MSPKYASLHLADAPARTLSHNKETRKQSWGTEKHLRDDGLCNAGHISVFFLGTYCSGFFFFEKDFTAR